MESVKIHSRRLVYADIAVDIGGDYVYGRGVHSVPLLDFRGPLSFTHSINFRLLCY